MAPMPVFVSALTSIIWQGRRYGTYAMAVGGFQGLQALSPRQWPPLGAFIKLPALRVVHDSPFARHLKVRFRAACPPVPAAQPSSPPARCRLAAATAPRTGG